MSERILFMCFLFCITLSSPVDAQLETPIRHRLIILADMGNEPDEEQQMVHMLMYSNEFDLEGLIAVTGYHLRDTTHPELFLRLIDGYEKVLNNLKQHDDGWHSPGYLREITVSGQSKYGIKDVREGNSSPGSELIIQSVTKDDPRPVWIVVNAGSNTLAQALYDYRSRHSDEEMSEFISKIRVFENGAQDDAGAWICAEFPEIHWIRSKTQTYCYGGPGWNDRTYIGPYTWQPYEFSETGQNFWVIKHIKAEHGPLGALYPLRQFSDGALRHMEGGGTIPWMGLVNKGLFDINKPHWGGWGGRFSEQKEKNIWSGYEEVRMEEEKVAPFYVYNEAADYWINPETGIEYNSPEAAIWRWRRAMYNDFLCRMDWCISSFEEANHNPVAAVNQDQSDHIIHITAKPEQVLTFDASASFDPDKDDLEMTWWQYKEAGTYTGDLTKDYADLGNQLKARVKIPENSAGKQLHLILEVKDQNPIASLYDYRRIVIDISNH